MEVPITQEANTTSTWRAAPWSAGWWLLVPANVNERATSATSDTTTPIEIIERALPPAHRFTLRGERQTPGLEPSELRGPQYVLPSAAQTPSAYPDDGGIFGGDFFGVIALL